MLAAHQVDLVLTDINMPKMDGMQLLAAIKKDPRWSGIPVLMITTEASSKAVADAARQGAAGYLKKPFTPTQIREQLALLAKSA